MEKLWKYLAFSGASALVLGASAIAAHHTEADKKIRAFYEAAVADFVACDTEAVGKYGAEGQTGYYPDSLDLHMEDSDEARQAEIAFCEEGGKNELAYEIRDIVHLTDAALVLGKGHYKRTEPDGNVSIDTDYSFTEVLVKTDDGWKFRHSHIGVAIPMDDAGGE